VVVTFLPDEELAGLSVLSLGVESPNDEEPCDPFKKAWGDSKADLFHLFNTGKTIAIHCRGLRANRVDGRDFTSGVGGTVEGRSGTNSINSA
jgi:hypothetical protein